MLLAILSICSQEELLESDHEADGRAIPRASDAEIQKRRQVIKNKILAVGRMQRVFQLLRFVQFICFDASRTMLMSDERCTRAEKNRRMLVSS